LLSQVLVAFTVEFDKEFERRMIEAGYRGARLSLAVWANPIRFVAEGMISVRDLAAKAHVRQYQFKTSGAPRYCRIWEETCSASQSQAWVW
jgi:hypothetical protein